MLRIGLIQPTGILIFKEPIRVRFYDYAIRRMHNEVAFTRAWVAGDVELPVLWYSR